MIHYHGTPITPRAQLLGMGGRHFCVSFASPQDLKTVLSIGQSVMFDNGAFTAYTQGKPFDVDGYIRWLEPILVPPHWAVMPDAIDGTLDDQYRMMGRWPRETYGYSLAAAVFHLHEPLEHLWFLCNAYPKVCLGSSGEFWEIGTSKWIHRMDEVFNYLERRTMKDRPWIHGLRMLGQVDGGWPLASADSTNVAQNHHIKGCANCMAQRLDHMNPSPKWGKREQGEFQL